MKKIVSLLLILAVVVSAFALASCGGEKKPSSDNNETDNNTPAQTLKLGLGVHVKASATDAIEDKAGQGQATITAAAVLVDANGKIVKAVIDCADNKVNYTFDGKAVAVEEFKTKYEQGSDYGMVAYGGSAKEWFEQVDAFCALIVGKTADEVKALVVDGDKGTDDVISAGCTITIAEFAQAIEKAIANATESKATADNTLKLGLSTAQTVTDATEDKPGTNKVETTLFAAALDAEGKVVAASSDCVEVSFGFDLTGKSTFDATAEILTKKEKGANYGMVAYGGATKEWFEQAAAFDATAIGKTPAEIAGFVGEDGRGNADVQAAGCTIYVTGFTKAAAKLG